MDPNPEPPHATLLAQMAAWYANLATQPRGPAPPPSNEPTPYPTLLAQMEAWHQRQTKDHHPWDRNQ